MATVWHTKIFNTKKALKMLFLAIFENFMQNDSKKKKKKKKKKNEKHISSTEMNN